MERRKGILAQKPWLESGEIPSCCKQGAIDLLHAAPGAGFIPPAYKRMAATKDRPLWQPTSCTISRTWHEPGTVFKWELFDELVDMGIRHILCSFPSSAAMGLVSGWWKDNLSIELEEGGALTDYNGCIDLFQGTKYNVMDEHLRGVIAQVAGYAHENAVHMNPLDFLGRTSICGSRITADLLIACTSQIPFGVGAPDKKRFLGTWQDSRCLGEMDGEGMLFDFIWKTAMRLHDSKLKSHTCGETGCSVYSVAVIDHTHACHEKMCISHGAAEMCMIHCTARYPPEVSGRRDMVQTSKVVLRKTIITVATDRTQQCRYGIRRGEGTYKSVGVPNLARTRKMNVMRLDSREKYSSERRQRRVASSCDWNQALIGRTSGMYEHVFFCVSASQNYLLSCELAVQRIFTIDLILKEMLRALLFSRKQVKYLNLDESAGLKFYQGIWAVRKVGMLLGAPRPGLFDCQEHEALVDYRQVLSSSTLGYVVEVVSVDHDAESCGQRPTGRSYSSVPRPGLFRDMNLQTLSAFVNPLEEVRGNGSSQDHGGVVGSDLQVGITSRGFGSGEPDFHACLLGARRGESIRLHGIAGHHLRHTQEAQVDKFLVFEGALGLLVRSVNDLAVARVLVSTMGENRAASFIRSCPIRPKRQWSSTSSASSSSYPRLDDLCPAEDLQLESWQDFGQLFDRWLSLHRDDSLPAPGKRTAADPPIAGNPHWELALAMKPFIRHELSCGPRGPTIGRAEICTISERDEMMFLGVITLDGMESSSSKLVYARLWVYMDDPTTLLSLGYAMHLGRRSPSPPSGVSPTRKFSFDGIRLLNHRFMAACQEMGLGRLDKVESMLRGIDERELEEVTRLVSQSASVVRAKYRGKTVALKIMDLTCWRSDFETCLKSTYEALGSGAREALQAMHDRGILHGGIDNKSIVVSNLERSGRYAGYLLGFRRAEFVPQSVNYKRQMAEEWLRLEESLAVYAPKRML
ncbi:hypothetical protein SELMODRAFT_412869 [Selaginella moellendorffii]|uniref:Uncharacterized protein n=1 Tax=Selaginella moellendorffii TaxID=88036 RepID=D8RML0_SELML|nr:hypothetical protein SELMODRAFT_412869 [Selaginella moellendorffii]